MRPLVICATIVLALTACSRPVPDAASAAARSVPVPAAVPVRVAADPVVVRVAAGADRIHTVVEADQLAAWLAGWEAAGRPDTGIADGVAIARARRAELAALIVRDPQAAIARRLSWVQRAALPPAVLALAERPIVDDARLAATARLGADGAQAVTPVVVLSDGQVLASHTWGRRQGMLSKSPVPVWGIAIDGDAAIADQPGRALEPGEPLAERRVVADACPVSGAPVAAGPGQPAAVLGKEVRYLCSGGHIQPAIARAADAEPVSRSVALPSSWTEGTKTLLYILAQFSDQTTNIPTQTNAQAQMAGVNSWMQTVSYGKFQGFTATYVAVTLPGTTAGYGSDDGKVLTDAKAAAATAGFASSGYDHQVVRYNGGPGGFSGQAYVGSPGTWLKTDSVGVAGHEFGHNLGLWHANYWNITTDSPAGPGSSNEYGNSFDTMGAASAGSNHFNAGSKRELDWLTDADIHGVTTSGTYRIHAQDASTILGSGRKQALRIVQERRLGSYTFPLNYWVEYRALFTGNQWMSNGVTVKLNSTGNDDEGDQLIDTTPGSADGKNDHGVTFGRTYSDAYAGIHITPTGFGGTTPQSIDVVVNLGTFAGNQAPVISALTGPTTLAPSTSGAFAVTASDPDGDALAWHWDFADGSLSTNAASVSRSWSAARHYPVQVTVSDMKGGVARATLVVTVGVPATRTISGTVRDGGGSGVGGVRVHNGLTGGNYRGVYTADDGTYTLGNIADGSVSLTAVKPGWGAFTASPANPVTVAGAAVTGRDFTGSALPVVTVTAVDANAAEGASDTATFRLTRTGSTAAALNVAYTMSGVAGTSDYSLAGGSTTTATIAAGSASQDIVLTATADSLAESAETAVLTIAESAAYAAGAPVAATITIAGLPPPANDAFASAITLSGSSVSTTGSNVGATKETGEPVHWNSGETSSVWWTWTAPSAGSCTIDLAGSGFDTVLAVYTGTTVSTLTKITSNDDATGTTSRVAFTAASGITYAIAVASYGGTQGAITLALTHAGSGAAAPTIQAIAAQACNEDGSTGAVAVTIADSDTAVSALTLSATSSNAGLLPVSAIAFGGSGANRTLTATPAANASGTTTVTVTVSDGAQSAATAFVLTVAAVNDTPTITAIADQSTAVDTAVGPLGFSIADVETAVGSLTMTRATSDAALLPLAGIVLGGSGASRSVTVTPASAATGSATVTITVSDGTASAARSFQVTVGAAPSGGSSAGGGGGSGGGGSSCAGGLAAVVIFPLLLLMLRRRRP